MNSLRVGQRLALSAGTARCACALARPELQIFRQHQPRGRRFDHHGSLRSLSVTTGKGTSATSGHLMRELGHRARHVIGRGHDDQRTESRVAAQRRVSTALPTVLMRRMVEVDAAGEQPLVAAASGARFRRGWSRIDAGDQQPLAAPAASSSSASVMREAPPVSTTMPSALRSSGDLGRSARCGRTRRSQPARARSAATHDQAAAWRASAAAAARASPAMASVALMARDPPGRIIPRKS